MKMGFGSTFILLQWKLRKNNLKAYRLIQMGMVGGIWIGRLAFVCRAKIAFRVLPERVSLPGEIILYDRIKSIHAYCTRALGRLHPCVPNRALFSILWGPNMGFLNVWCKRRVCILIHLHYYCVFVSYPRLVRELSLTWSKIWKDSMLAKKHNWILFLYSVYFCSFSSDG